MIRIVLGPDDLARVRVRFNALLELSCSLRALVDPQSHPAAAAWAAETRSAVRGLDLRPLEAVHEPGRQVPDFMTGPSHPARPHEDIARLTHYPSTAIEADLRHSCPEGFPPEVLELASDHHARACQLARLLAAYHERALADRWPRLLAVLESDLLHRARTLALYGPEVALNDLHPGIRYRDGVLEIAGPEDVEVHARARGLVVNPVAFGWPRVLACTNPGYRPVVSFPARGAAALWERAGGNGRAAAVPAGRLRVLAALRAGASTTELAARVWLSPAAVSQHLRNLHRDGLVEASRAGRFVHYRLSDAGAAVLDGLEAGARQAAVRGPGSATPSSR
jgi:DNA-binding transcriptional ArsR family regulator